jgi:hypothetical protein
MAMREAQAAGTIGLRRKSSRDRWFWIDDRDLKSKTAFTYLIMMFPLTETRAQQGGAPIVTLRGR